MPRYVLHSVSDALRLPCIRDNATVKVFAYGSQFYFQDFRGSHRRDYTDADAARVVEWLNESMPWPPPVTRATRSG